MYAAIYSYLRENGRRKHIGNVTHIEHSTTLRTFDFSTCEIKGKCDFSMDDSLLYVINDEKGRQRFSGFIKQAKIDDRSELLTFSGEDFKRILDTDIILDFSHVEDVDLTLEGIFHKVSQQISGSGDPFITMLDLEFIIPADSTDTKAIADYTGQYIVVNALQFLKVYLAYYEYYINPSYDVTLDRVTFAFTKMNAELVEIKLKDFTHEKTSSDIRVNKTIATISFKTTSDEASWIASDVAYYDNQPYANRGTMIGLEPPKPDAYAVGFALRLISGYEWQLATESEYDAETALRTTITIPQYVGSECTIAPTFEQAIAAVGDPDNAQEGIIVRALMKVNSSGEICYGYPIYIKSVPISASYHRRSDVTYYPRPVLPERVYTLGNDNRIYEGYAPEEMRIYPIVSKVFEATYLSEAQLNAVYEIVNNRYVENIIITQDSMTQTLDLSSLELFTPIRVYDSGGDYKDIPISEKTYIHRANEQRLQIKLGFKKTLLTEIIKNEIGQPSVVKSSGSGASSVINKTMDVPISDELNPPDPKDTSMWFVIE